MQTRIRTALLLGSIIGLVAQTASAQAATGTISGTVRDTAGTAISGASIQAKNTETGLVYSAVSGGTGDYAVNQLPPGQYAVTVTLKGMKTYAHSYLTVERAGVIREDVALEVDVDANYTFPYNPPPIRASTPRAPSRDFFDEDADLVVTKPRVSLNGSALEMPQDLGTVKGKIVWIYAPGHGRYLLSLAPRPGFDLAGQVGGTSLDFELQSDELQMDAKERIAEGSAKYNLYVLHQADWVPPNQSDRRKAQVGSTDRTN